MDKKNIEHQVVYATDSLEDIHFKFLHYKKENYEEIAGQVENVLIDGKGLLKLKFQVVTFDEKITENSSLIQVSFLDENGNKLLGPDDYPVSKTLGTYQYLKTSHIDKPILNEIDIPVVSNKVKFIQISFIAWKHVTNYIDMRTFSKKFISYNGDVKSIESDTFFQKLECTDKVIVLYTTAPHIGHATLELRPNRLAKEFIKLGYKVVFFTFNKIPIGLELNPDYKDKLVQYYKDDVNQCVNILDAINLEEKVFICSSFPDIIAMTTIEKIKMSKGWRTLYEIRDDMEEFNRVGYSKWYSSALEVKVARLVDKIITVSPRLAQKIQVMASKIDDKLNSNKVKVIQNAAPNIFIEKAKYLRNKDFFEIKNTSNIIGYIGHLTQAWFDWSLLITTAKKHPTLIFEIIGHGYPEKLELPENIHYLGPKNHDEFLKISERWKVGLIPFIRSPLTSGVDPNKIYEYLAANLIVVTADMGSVRECPATFVYDSPRDFEKCLLEAMNVEYNDALLEKVNLYVEHSKWSNRARSILDFVFKADE